MIKAEMVCYGRTVSRGSIQEWYETSARTARRRAKELRAAGFSVSVAPMGIQVTKLGRIKMTLVSAHFDPTRQVPELPPVRIERC